MRQSVSEEDVVELTRRYHVSKNNKGFSRTIATVRRYLRKDVEPFYLMIYKWAAGSDKAFTTPRHGNSQEVSAGPYFAKDPSLMEKVYELLQSNASTDAIYNQLTKDTVKTVGENISNPKFIDNRKHYLAQQEKEGRVVLPERSEAEVLIYNVKSTNSMLQSVVFNQRGYVALNHLPEVLANVKKFCVNGKSILRVDATFELVDGLWLTDSTFIHEGLVDAGTGKHPEFPGPSLWRFRKDHQTYRCFAV